MPYNRVNDVKAMLLWLLILRSDAENEKKEKIENNKFVKPIQVPTYYPGLMLMPVPEAGFILGHLDIAFWAAFLYLLGSILYMIDSFYMWAIFNPNYTDDALNPAIYLNTIAAAVFVANALACFLDWWLQLKQLSAMNLVVDESYTGGVLISDIPKKLSMLYFYNNIFFLAAAIIYMIQAIWMEDSDTDLLGCYSRFCGEFWINFWGSLLYLLSSICSISEYFEYKRLRAQQKLPPMPLFTFDLKNLDWFGWGDWLFLATSIVAVFQVMVTTFVDQSVDLLNGLYMLENFFFLIDSMAYFIGYVLYMYELRQALVTGLVDTAQTGPINTLLGDCGGATATCAEYVPVTATTTNINSSYHNDDIVVNQYTPLQQQFIQPNPTSINYYNNVTGTHHKVSFSEIKQRLHEARIKRNRLREESTFGGLYDHNNGNTALNPLLSSATTTSSSSSHGGGNNYHHHNHGMGVGGGTTIDYAKN